jgi:hypothetical protein
VIQNTPYVGHPAYKAMGARAAYTLATGLVIGGGAALGVIALLARLLPEAAVAPILIFIGLEITAQAFVASPRRHAAAVAVAFLPAVAALVIIQGKCCSPVPAGARPISSGPRGGPGAADRQRPVVTASGGRPPVWIIEGARDRGRYFRSGEPAASAESSTPAADGRSSPWVCWGRPRAPAAGYGQPRAARLAAVPGDGGGRPGAERLTPEEGEHLVAGELELLDLGRGARPPGLDRLDVGVSHRLRSRALSASTTPRQQPGFPLARRGFAARYPSTCLMPVSASRRAGHHPSLARRAHPTTKTLSIGRLRAQT